MTQNFLIQDGAPGDGVRTDVLKGPPSKGCPSAGACIGRRWTRREEGKERRQEEDEGVDPKGKAFSGGKGKDVLPIASVPDAGLS